jgi:hypothetical protein
MRVELLPGTDHDVFSEWLRIWTASATRDPHLHPHYVRLTSNYGGDKSVRVIRTELDRSVVLLPVVCQESPEGISLRGPYGFGGLLLDASEAFDSEQYAALLSQWSKLSRSTLRMRVTDRTAYTRWARTIEDRQVIAIDLRIPEMERWMSYEHKVRKNVKRAIEMQVVVEHDVNLESLDEFIDVYEQTMIRRDADGEYRYSHSWFEELLKSVPGSELFVAKCSGVVVSGEILLRSVDSIYSFLGGTDRQAFHLRPNDLLKHRICEVGSLRGLSSFVLGGGREPEDGIYRYKRSFAPSGVLNTFAVGWW